MKSHREIQIEARRLEQLGQEYAGEQRQAVADLTGHEPAPRVLMVFPDSVVASRHEINGEDPEDKSADRPHRWVEVALDNDSVEYRLMEGVGERLRGKDPVFLLGSDSGFEVLEAGYELGESERLGELLAPFAERAEAEEVADSVEPSLVEEIETIIGAGEFSAAARLGAKADIVEFLEGRIEPSAFINAAIARGYSRDGESETTIREQRAERIVIDQP